MGYIVTKSAYTSLWYTHLHLVKIVDIIKCIVYLKTAALSIQ